MPTKFVSQLWTKLSLLAKITWNFLSSLVTFTNHAKIDLTMLSPFGSFITRSLNRLTSSIYKMGVGMFFPHQIVQSGSTSDISLNKSINTGGFSFNSTVTSVWSDVFTFTLTCFNISQAFSYQLCRCILKLLRKESKLENSILCKFSCKIVGGNFLSPKSRNTRCISQGLPEFAGPVTRLNVGTSLNSSCKSVISSHLFIKKLQHLRICGWVNPRTWLYLLRYLWAQNGPHGLLAMNCLPTTDNIPSRSKQNHITNYSIMGKQYAPCIQCSLSCTPAQL